MFVIVRLEMNDEIYENDVIIVKRITENGALFSQYTTTNRSVYNINSRYFNTMPLGRPNRVRNRPYRMVRRHHRVTRTDELSKTPIRNPDLYQSRVPVWRRRRLRLRLRRRRRRRRRWAYDKYYIHTYETDCVILNAIKNKNIGTYICYLFCSTNYFILVRFDGIFFSTYVRVRARA